MILVPIKSMYATSY